MKTKKEMQKKYIHRRVAFLVIVILLILLFIGIKIRNNIQKIAFDENALNIAGENLDISKIISEDPNVPVVGAGMIPIKWDGSYWRITTTSDPDWYNYSKGEWANVMLSDGYYKSEAQPGINPDEQIADERNVGDQIPEDKLGTIFTWIPRIAYSETEVAYLKGTSILEYMYTTESCFNLEKYGANNLDLAFTGVWVGQHEFASKTELDSKNTEMQAQENTQGLIANEMVESITNSEKNAIQKLQEKYNVTQNQTMLQDVENMQYRQVIKIINTNNKLPIVATHEVIEEGIQIKATYTENGIKYIVDKEGNKLENNLAKPNEEELQYTFYLVDNIGNIRKYKMNYGSGAPYLVGFNKSNTFYVTYDELGLEESIIPIGEEAPATWYSYDTEQRKWANIVVRNNGSEAYYTWIPRYMYTLDQTTQTSNVLFVDLDNVYTDPVTGKKEDLNDTEYILPEAFTWKDPEDENNVVQLPGFWISKYKLRDADTYKPVIYGLGGTITVQGVVAQFGTSYDYDMYLIKDGKRIEWNTETNTYTEGQTPINLKEVIDENGTYKYTGLSGGKYTVNIIIKDSTGKHVRAVAKQITVIEKVKEHAPNLSKYNENLTYYVIYDENGNEISYQPIGTTLTEEEQKQWYNYDEGRKATIVVREDGKETYYEWIPRYQCSIEDNTRIMYISTNTTKPAAGYTIPEEFIITEGGTTTHLDGYWKEKVNYSNRLVANVAAGKDKININNVICDTTDVTYEIYLIQDGTIQKTETLENAEHLFSGLDVQNPKYAVSIIAKNAEGVIVSGYAKEVILNEIKIDIDTDSFNPNTTFYVAYTDEGVEESYIPIGENPPENWYDYTKQQWANIVVRNNGNEAYYTWVPRYQYKVDTTNQKSIVQFIPTSITQEKASEGYTIPEAFTWEGKELNGFWISKYKLRDNGEYAPNIYGIGNSIAVNGIVSAIGADYEYDMYLIRNGQFVENADSSIKINLKEAMNEKGNYRYTNLEHDNYAVNIIVKDAEGNHVRGITKQITYFMDEVQEHEPNLSKYNQNLTYYVTYEKDDEGNAKETSVIPIGETAPEDWYDYTNDQYATIVVRNESTETYYEWIPRYQYAIEDNERIIYIPDSKHKADDGYIIPEEFIITEGETTTHLDGYWKEKTNDTSVVTATVAFSDDKINVYDISCNTANVSFEIYLIKEGTRQNTDPITVQNNQHIFEGLEVGITYAVNIVAKNAEGNIIAGYAKQVTLPKIVVDIDKNSFNPNTTFYVTYNENGEEQSNIPIGENQPENWYDYSKQQWANIVVRNNGSEAYYTWIPRYQYKLDTTNQKSNIEFISTNKTEADDGYQIPEAFTWVDPENENSVKELPGFWISKYKLRDTDTLKPVIYGLGGTITIEGVVAQFGTSYDYDMYLIHGGQIVENADGSESINLKTEMDENGIYKYTGLSGGNYTVNIMIKDSTGKHVRAVANQVTVLEEQPINPPDLSEYNINLTYYVEYTATGEISNEPIKGTEPENWYDYTEGNKATIVVRDTGIETYYEWIPRYQCQIADNNRISYIPTSKIKPDEGYMIPEEFTPKDENGNIVHIDGYWSKKEEYSSRIIASIASGESQKGEKQIRVSNITTSSETEVVQYNVYLIQDGKIIDDEPITSSGSHVFNITDTGKYAILVEQPNIVTGTIAGYAKEVRVEELEPPDVTGFRVDTTYIVTYDSEGNAVETQTLKSVLSDDSVIGDDNTLISGKIALNKIDGTWYDYTEQKWANIVVRNNEKEAYFTWVPRYQYKLDTTNELANVILIPTSITQEKADEGYTIPEAFTWNGEELPGFWISKYKLRD